MRFLFGFIFSACLSLSFCENLTSISSSTSVETTENTVSSSGTIVKGNTCFLRCSKEKIHCPIFVCVHYDRKIKRFFT